MPASDADLLFMLVILVVPVRGLRVAAEFGVGPFELVFGRLP